jgi:hypothetical protein
VKKTSRRTRGSRTRSPRPPRERWPRPPHEAALVAFAALADRLGLRWYVFGAQAVSLHGFPRATADLDITVELGEVRPAAFVAALERSGFSARFPDEDFIATTRVIPVVHEVSRLPIDFVLAGPGLEQRFLDEVVAHRLGEIQVPVLSIENLIVTKLLAGRPKDLQDIRELLDRADAIDHARIDALLVEIETALDQHDLRPVYLRLRAGG